MLRPLGEMRTVSARNRFFGEDMVQLAPHLLRDEDDFSTEINLFGLNALQDLAVPEPTASHDSGKIKGAEFFAPFIFFIERR